MEEAKRSVANLQDEITKSTVSEAQQATLDDVALHIEKYQDDPDAHHETLRERLEDALLEFGAEHHSLAESIRLAIYDLSNAGV
ncbi:MAG: DUF4404 family protein [Candidatus Promineifilaceae bacterium]|jgi:Domain of unknown function (DUF4404)